jgi:small subunit ribosomal protein S20
MPQIRSAEKRVRQESKRAARNRGRKERFRKTLREFKKVVSSPSKAAEAAKTEQSVEVFAARELAKVTRAIDKAGDKGIVHRNAVNRRKSRAALALNAALKTPASASSK